MTKASNNVTPSEISHAAKLIANNVDILTEILLWSPAKSTIRFKSVSKHWLSLLSDSQFATNHSTRNPTSSPISGLYFSNQDTLNFVSLHGRRHNLPSLSFLDWLGGRSTLKIAHSCNGLMLCYTSAIHGRLRQYIVCNPTTKKYRLLFKPDRVVDCRWSGCLVFDSSKSPLHYKVVLVAHGCYQIDVYSSESKCWRKVVVSHINKFFGRGVFWKGAIHWLCYDVFMKRFDIDVKEIIAMPKPQSPKILSWDKIMYFGECGGGLILIQSCSYCPNKLRIFEVKRDYSGCVIKCRVDLKPLISAFPKMKSRRNDNYCSQGFKVLWAMKGESEGGYVLLLGIPGRIISYDAKKKTWDVLRDLVPHESNGFGLNSYSSYAFPFIETLFPV